VLLSAGALVGAMVTASLAAKDVEAKPMSQLKTRQVDAKTIKINEITNMLVFLVIFLKTPH